MLAFFPVTAFALVFSLTAAQTIIPATIPICAQTCPILLDAQRGCVPPAAPVEDPAIYQSCFCLSALLTQLPSSPAAVCPGCPAGDLVLLQSWFGDLCKPGAPVNPVSAPTPTTVLVSSTTSRAVPPTATANNAAAGGSTISTRPPPDNRSWMKSHWRWVVMLIILFFGFAIIAWAGWFFHRRYHRRHDGPAVSPEARQPDIGSWGPGHSAHDFGAAPGPGVGPPINEKGKGRELELEIQPGAGQAPQQLGSTNGSRRLKKSWLPRKG